MLFDKIQCWVLKISDDAVVKHDTVNNSTVSSYNVTSCLADIHYIYMYIFLVATGFDEVGVFKL